MTRPEISGLDRRRYQWPTDYVVLFGAVLLLILLRTHAFAAPLEVDECNYAYIGQRLAAGDRFYIDVWDHQPPGMFWFSAVLVWLFGSGEIVFRVAAMVAAIGTLVLIHAICRQSLGRIAAGFAVILFALASSDPGVAGEGCNREIYMNLLGAAAIFVLLGQTRRDILLAGFFLGLSSLVKTVVVTQWLLLATGLMVWRLLSPWRIQQWDIGSQESAVGGALRSKQDHGAVSRTRATQMNNSRLPVVLRSVALFRGRSRAGVGGCLCSFVG